MEIEEGRGEDLRLLYVALTRAQHQAVLWWAGAHDSQHSPLARLLFDRDASGVVPPYGAAARTDAAVEAAALGARAPRRGRAGRPARAARWQWQPETQRPELEAARVRPDPRHRVAPGLVLEHHPRRCTSSPRSGASPSPSSR